MPKTIRKSAASSAKSATQPVAKIKVATVSALAERLSSLENVVQSLVANASDPSAASNSASASSLIESNTQKRKFWAIHTIEEGGAPNGGVVFAGHVSLPTKETYAWQIENDTNGLLAANWSVANAPLAALAHPMRLSILKSLLHGERTTQALQVLPDMGTTGQLYHHLKELEAAGWIRQPRRGEYQVLAERVVPLLAIVSACEVTDK